MGRKDSGARLIVRAESAGEIADAASVTFRAKSNPASRTLRHMNPRLWRHGVIAYPRGTTRYREDLHPATGSNPTASQVPHGVQHCTRGKRSLWMARSRRLNTVFVQLTCRVSFSVALMESRRLPGQHQCRSSQLKDRTPRLCNPPAVLRRCSARFEGSVRCRRRCCHLAMNWPQRGCSRQIRRG